MTCRRILSRNLSILGFSIALISQLGGSPAAAELCTADNTVIANVVALDQVIWANRLGTSIPGGMVFALERDVCKPGGKPDPVGMQTCDGTATAGSAMLKPYKRPRPMVLRLNQGQCLTIHFKNLLSATGSQFKTRAAGVHIQGMEPVKTGDTSNDCPANSICNDASWVGSNPDALVVPGDSATYQVYAAHEGTFVLYSAGDAWSGGANADGGTLSVGLFGAVHVQPGGAEYYRSQVTATDLTAAALLDSYGQPEYSAEGQPLIDYGADYKNTVSSSCYVAGTCRVGPVLSMLCTPDSVKKGFCTENELVHSDLTAIITGPAAGRFSTTGPEEPPALESSYALPDRLQPYREFTTMYHEVFNDTQAFNGLYTNATLTNALKSGADNFAINYGMGGIGSEIIANRLGVGPMAKCTACKYEEFFLTSWAVGDPAMVVDKPADSGCTYGNPPTCPDDPATVAYYPDDPSNVYHSYISDHTKFRVMHGGSDLHHLHHQHAHQWMHSPDTSNGDYTDSQSIGPGSAFTMEMVYNGGGNVNQTVGDSIFHCHFYPHFAGGMWSLWRVHDVYETGTVLNADGTPKAGPNRALIDGEITAGTPIPAVVPLPTLAMPPMPGLVQLTDDGKQAEVCSNASPAGECKDPISVLDAVGSVKVDPADYKNPGFPFFIPGLGGQRAPHPPADFAYVCSDNGQFCTPAIANIPADLRNCASVSATCDALDGGLPRHVVAAGSTQGCGPDTTGTASVDCPDLNAIDFSKVLEKIDVTQLDDRGTLVEQLAMAAHATRFRRSAAPSGTTCVVNGYNPPPSDENQDQCDGLSGTECKENPYCRPAQYIYNGLPPVQGAPYADPCTQYTLAGGHLEPYVQRRYKAADIQFDAVFNKEGWHFPQQRIISLWGDVEDVLDGTRAPEPLFFRANAGECIDYTLANLVPNLYELDDFEVRTPTDILGQHIHLVKFDVTSSDGATNGWNYEDGTFAPNEVTERIQAINQAGGIQGGSCRNGICRHSGAACKADADCISQLAGTGLPFFGAGPGGQWVGAQATVQRWWADPLLNQSFSDPGVDRTLRTVFTHDHFGPSTHQQAGLYAGLVIEPEGSNWFCNDAYGDPSIAGSCNSIVSNGNGPFGGQRVGDITGRAGTRPGPGRPVTGAHGPPVNDGGPTTWQAVIEPDGSAVTCDAGICSNRIAYCQQASDCQNAGYREFMLEIQDTTLTFESFMNLPSTDFGGVCSDNPDSLGYSCVGNGGSAGCCTPATHTTAADVSNCADPATAVCYAFGFCSTDNTEACRLATWQQPVDVSQCTKQPTPGPPLTSDEITCNLVAGIPSQTTVNALQALNSSGNPPVNLQGWNTTAVDASNGQPELITLFSGTNNFSVNYRNEPLFPRVTTASTAQHADDLSFAYASIDRGFLRGYCSNDEAFYCSNTSQCSSGGTCILGGFCSDDNSFCQKDGDCTSPATCQHHPYQPSPGVERGDPFTPLLRAYTGDDVQVRVLVGAHINPHNLSIQGVNWLMEPSFVDSGWRNSQVMGISEHFELLFKVPSFTDGSQKSDYLYMPGAANIEQSGGNWGILRAYGSTAQDYLRPLPQNPTAGLKPATGEACDSPTVTYEVVATTAQQALPPQVCSNATTTPCTQDSDCGSGNSCIGALVYDSTAASGVESVTSDPNAILYFNINDLEGAGGGACSTGSLTTCKLKGSLEVQPLVLRAPAGACIQVTLYNAIDSSLISLTGATNPVPPAVASTVSTEVGLHPQLVSFNTTTSNGFNVGANPTQTVAIGGSKIYTWYAGHILDDGSKIPIEFGAANLVSSDPINHFQHGLGGALIIEPEDWTWDPSLTGTSAQIKSASAGNFQEFVLVVPDGLNKNPATPRLGGDKINAVNYRAPKLANRSCDTGVTGDLSCVVSAEACCGTTSSGGCAPCLRPPATFTACAGDAVRFRLLSPGGINTDNVFELYGHVWSEAPYTSLAAHGGCVAPTTHTNLASSSVISDKNGCPPCIDGFCQQNPTRRCRLDQDCALTDLSNAGPSLNEWQGSRMGIGPQNHNDFVIDSAGGTDKVPGDYLIRSYSAMHYNLGWWGIFEVLAPGGPTCAGQ